MRLIDADAMHIDFDKFVEHIRLMRKGKIPKAEIAILLDCKGMIDSAPTVDAVPVIRCKDCKYWNGSGKYCDYEMSGLENDFCSWAERKEE